MSPTSANRTRLAVQTGIAVACLVGGLVYPVSLAIANVRVAGQVSDRGAATDPTIYNPPMLAIVATAILLPIGAIVGFVTATEFAAIRRRARTAPPR